MSMEDPSADRVAASSESHLDPHPPPTEVLTPSIGSRETGSETVNQTSKETSKTSSSGHEDDDEGSAAVMQPGGILKKRRIGSEPGSGVDAGEGGVEEETEKQSEMNILPSATIGPIQAASNDPIPEDSTNAVQGSLPTPPDTGRNHVESKMDVDESTQEGAREGLKVGQDYDTAFGQSVESREEPEAAGKEAAEDQAEATHLAASTPAPGSPAKSTATSASLAQAPSSTKSTTKPKVPKKKASTPATASASSSAPNSKKGSASAAVTSGGAKKGKGKGKTKVDELKGSTKPRSSSHSDNPPSAPTTPTRDRASASAHGTGTVESTPDPSPNKNAVYCICRKPYAEEEENITMLGCESCDNWFHPSCVGLSEEMVDLLDVYICKSCERNTHQRTIYKQVCKRDGCYKSVAGSLSKFCSPSCAFQHSHNLISGVTDKNTLKQLAKTFISFPPPKLGVQVTRHRPELKPSTSAPSVASTPAETKDDARLLDLQTQIEQVERAMAIVKARQRILETAIERCETLQPITIENGHHEAEEEEVVGKRGKKKKGSSINGGGKDDKPCGWVRLLIADDQQTNDWSTRAGVEGAMEVDRGDATEGEGRLDATDILAEGTCYNGRRKCDRHQGWQKTIAVSLEVELSGLERNHQSLVEYHDSLKTSTDRQQMSSFVRNEFVQRKEGLR
ncbi:hypothetical protein IAU59_002195 [Kwoniella sp. CBS 9459]